MRLFRRRPKFTHPCPAAGTRGVMTDRFAESHRLRDLAVERIVEADRSWLPWRRTRLIRGARALLVLADEELARAEGKRPKAS